MNTRTTVALPLFHRIIITAACAILLAGCGGGGSHASLPAAIPGSGSGLGTSAAGSAPATFVFTFPKPSATSAKRRSPKYLSSATASISVTVTDTKNHGDSSDIFASVPAALKAQQNFNPANLAGSPTTPGQCGTDPGNAGNYECTAVFQLPVGDNTLTISSHDAANGGGNVLSQQITTVWTKQGVANGPTGQYAVSLDANANTMTVSGTAACATGPVGSSFGSVGTSAVPFNVAYKDLANQTIHAPGLPNLQVQNNHGGDTTYHNSSGTIDASGGATVTFSIDQSAQTITLTPSTAPLTGATINVKATAKNSNGTSDGLGFSTLQSFTFTTGTAPPMSFLALIEQTGALSGKVDLYTIDTTNSTFAPSNVTGGGNVLAVTNSTNEGKPDIDNPRDITFDSGGNLLIANGGQGGAMVAGSQDYGDFACIPAGAISTGSTTTTTSSADAFDPESIAFNTGDSSVTMGNVPASATYNTVRYLLGNTYVEGTAAQNIANVGTVGATSVISIPSLTAGTFAAAITNGTTISKIVLKGPTGTETPITDTDISSPEALGWDNSSNQQIAVANHQIVTTNRINDNKSKLAFFTTAGTKVKSVQLGTDPTTPSDSYMFGDKIAVSADGHVAVAGGTADGTAEVRVFDNTSNRAQVGTGPIPFDSYTNTACTVGNFGSVTVVHSMRWLTNNLLLIMLQANTAGKQGAYIFDINQLVTTPSGLYRYDPNGAGCKAIPTATTSPKQTGFQPITNAPLSAAYKP